MKIGKVAERIAPKWTKNGFRLLSKEMVDLGVLPKNLIPENCTALEEVKVETNFGKGLTKLYSFFDKDGVLLKKVLLKRKDKFLGRPQKLVRDYRREGDVLFSRTRIFNPQGNITEGTKEAFYIIPIRKDVNGMTRMKLHYTSASDGSRFEEQVYENLAPRGYIIRTNRIKTTAKRLEDGRLVDKAIEGDKDLIEQVKDDPYLYIRNYDKADFALTESWYAQECQNVKGLKGEFILKKIKKKCLGFFNSGTKNVTVDASKHKCKPDLIDTIHHEYRHKWQNNFVWDYLKSKFKKFIGKCEQKLYTKEDEALAKKMWLADIFYCPSEFSHKRYYNNFLEVDARNAGEKAKDKYQKLSLKLAEILGIPEEMVYCTDFNRSLLKFINQKMKSGEVKIVKIPDLFIAANTKNKNGI